MTLVKVYDCTHDLVPALPKDGYAYAGYVGHGLSSIIWTPEDWASLPPGAHHLTITAFADTDADILDYEPGNTHVPSEAATWHARQLARGGLACIYSDRADKPSLDAAVGPFLWWAAVPQWSPYTLYPGSGAVQYADLGAYDVSSFEDSLFWGPHPPPPPPPPVPPSQEVTVNVPVLAQGSQGPPVRSAQLLLTQIAADGVFGPATHNAVINFQSLHGLTQDGVIGTHTWGALVGVPQ